MSSSLMPTGQPLGWKMDSFPVGERFIVVPKGGRIDPGARLPILLGPGRAFGSGEHETTRSCLEALEDLHVNQVMKALDLGCGTAILSIAAARLGAGCVTAVDIDPHAVAAARRNVIRNDLERTVSVRPGGIEEVGAETSFDLVMANLQGDIILSMIDGIGSVVKTGGSLLLSGVQYEYMFEVKKAFLAMGFELLRLRVLDEFSTLVMEKG